MPWGVTRRWRRICHSWRRRRRRRGEHGILRNRGPHPGALSLRGTEPIGGHLGSPKIAVLPLRRLLRPRLTIGGPSLSWRRVLDRPLLGRHGILPLPWLRRRLHPWDFPRRCRPFAHRGAASRTNHSHLHPRVAAQEYGILSPAPSLWRYRRNAAVFLRPAFTHISIVDQALPQQPLGATFRHLCGSSR